MKKNKLLASAILTTLLSGSLIAGATYSLFTSTSTHDITVSSATVKLESSIDATTLKTTSFGEDTAVNGTFDNGGTAVIAKNGRDITLDKMTPGDKVSFNINFTNTSTVQIKYRITYKLVSDQTQTKAFFDALTKSPSEDTGYTLIAAGAAIDPITVTIELPDTTDENDNKLQNKTCTIAITVEAIQGNYVSPEEKALAKAKEDAIIELQTYFENTFDVKSQLQTDTKATLDASVDKINQADSIDAVNTEKESCKQSMIDTFNDHVLTTVQMNIAEATADGEATGNQTIKDNVKDRCDTLSNSIAGIDSLSALNSVIWDFNYDMEGILDPLKEKRENAIRVLEEQSQTLLRKNLGETTAAEFQSLINNAKTEKEITEKTQQGNDTLVAEFIILVTQRKNSYASYVESGKITQEELDSKFESAATCDDLDRIEAELNLLLGI